MTGRPWQSRQRACSCPEGGSSSGIFAIRICERDILTHYFSENEVGELFCGLRPLSIGTHCWKMRVKGINLVRAEVEAVFLKS
jgi:hypothetical protein